MPAPPAVPVELRLPSPPSSDGLPSPLSLDSDSTGPPLSEDLPSLSSGHSDWDSEADDADYDLMASRDFGSGRSSNPQSSVAAPDDEHMRLSFPDPMMDSDATQNGSSSHQDQGLEADYSLLLDAVPTSPETTPAVTEQGRLDESIVTDDGDDATPAASKVVERTSGSLEVEHLGDNHERTADIAAWVRLTGGASTRTGPESIATSAAVTPPLLSPRSSSPAPGFNNAAPHTNLSKFRESEKERPSSAAKLTSATPRETAETAECIKSKLEQLAAASHMSTDRKAATSRKIAVALTAAAVLVAAAAALADPTGLSFVRSFSASPAPLSVTSSSPPPPSSTNSLATGPTPRALGTFVAPPVVPKPVIVSVKRDQGPIPSCSMAHPGACALALVDTRTALAVFAVDTFASRSSLFGGSGSNSSPSTEPEPSRKERRKLAKAERKMQGRRPLRRSGGRRCKHHPGRKAIGFAESVRSENRANVDAYRPTFQEAFSTLQRASARALEEAKDKVTKFRKEQFSLATRSSEEWRRIVLNDPRVELAVASGKSKLTEAMKGLDVARRKASVVRRRFQLLEEIRGKGEIEIAKGKVELTKWLGRAKEEGSYRLKRATKGYRRLKRGEVGVERGRLVDRRHRPRR